MPLTEEKLEELLCGLPDPAGARLWLELVRREHPAVARKLLADAGLTSDLLALAAWSPLLATTCLTYPEYVAWLSRERVQSYVRTREELAESLGRFRLTNSQLPAQVLLSRFRRRELLRIFLRDIRRIGTIVETTEELSNLADAVLTYALTEAGQALQNRYGQPLQVDQRGRHAVADFTIVAMGKLGSKELNYASDVDLLFIYSHDGATSGAGTRGEISNREYFNKLAADVARVVGAQTGEGAAYRVDLRLRPHGRDGALACSVDEAARYYLLKAQAWELQALIRARAAAGSAGVFAQFQAQVTPVVFAQHVTAAEALKNVRLAKQKIDSQHGEDYKGFNVKLGRGGIREIEFIAQALQLAFGGGDSWLRAPHTLICLGRLAERGLITETEGTHVSDAYAFLRAVEHRAQMEHGLQTHAVPRDDTRRELLARRMNFSGSDALAAFDAELTRHTDAVNSVFARVFSDSATGGAHAEPGSEAADQIRADAITDLPAQTKVDHEARSPLVQVTAATGLPPGDSYQRALEAATRFAPYLYRQVSEPGSLAARPTVLDTAALADLITQATAASADPQRAQATVAVVAASLAKTDCALQFSIDQLQELITLAGTSGYFGELIAANPVLLAGLPRADETAVEVRDYRGQLTAAVESESSFAGELAALRNCWAACLCEIGALDAAHRAALAEVNRRQTLLAEASLDAGLLVARRELARRLGQPAAQPELALLGLGRLGGRGMDYGSDLDLVLLFDEAARAPYDNVAAAEIYPRLVGLLVTALSSLTRDGALYRVDLRLRPDGRDGPTCSGVKSFLQYMETRSVTWEWLAYVKLRAAAGDLQLGQRAETGALAIIHRHAQALEPGALLRETRRVRERLEQEKSRSRTGFGIDIKYAAGGMLDVYFAVRYLQLKHNVPDNDLDRRTTGSLISLRAVDALGAAEFAALRDGYALLRRLDHNIRLVVGRSKLLPGLGHPALEVIAARMEKRPGDLVHAVRERMRSIRAAYDRIMEPQRD